MQRSYNSVMVLGPTAVGKTSLGIAIARSLGGHILSADSRQVYKGLDIGSGKDLADYSADGVETPYHLIDITTLETEYSVFDYQRDFYAVFAQLQHQGILPVVVGGTGMYLDAIVRKYDLFPVPEDKNLRKELSNLPLEVLVKKLLTLKPDFHTKGSLHDRDRVIKAIEIETFMQRNNSVAYQEYKQHIPDVKPFIIGTSLPRLQLRENIYKRLQERLDGGMMEEVQSLHDSGYSWKRLELLGLEYRFVSEYLQGKIETKEALFTLLSTAICQFAKRQETWFRGMEKKGVEIHWLPSVRDKNIKLRSALTLIHKYVLTDIS
ncbi:MAG: tRNA (adenosine(37)-N6)-dimethylallyltransferase MiaA [Treponema sp.]|nr:tRNA (adenosine(37)-N6)-dimethylallyltransferase MiaA [Treponema sp.]